MGQGKSLVSFRGAPLIERALGSLRGPSLKPRIAGARSYLSGFAPALGADPDYPGLGPLSGICPAIEECRARFAVFIPVDMPLMPPSLVSYLVHHAEVTG